MNRIAACIASALSLVMLSCDLTSGQADNRQIVFTTTGSSFAPKIVVDDGAVVLWTFSDGDTSDSTSPSHGFGSEESREQSLKVTPWSALKWIVIGYDGGDGGSMDSDEETGYGVKDQSVTEVRNLDLSASSLEVWCSSYNKIASLDFSDFVKLETIECYFSSYLRSVTLLNCPSLKRACFEDCSLENLDLSGCPNLEDLRGAANNYPTITFADEMSSIWHICIRDNPQMTSQNLFESTAQFPNLRELYIWNDNQIGQLKISSTSSGLTLFAYGNSYTSAVFSGALQDETTEAYVDLSSNDLTSINITDCDQITCLDLRDNLLDSTEVGKVLSTLNDLGRINGKVYLTGNAVPLASATGVIASLLTKGWTVEVTTE